MILVGQRVNHKKYGEGIIEEFSHNESYPAFLVKFANESLRFVYPDAFVQEFIQAADSAVQESIMQESEDAKKEAAERAERKLEEERLAAALSEKKQRSTAKTASFEPSALINASSPLIAGKKYDTASNRIYEACIPAYNFSKEGLKEFGWNNRMYAKAATKEGYSVWMLAHSNWTDTKHEKWRNTISDGYRLITEDWEADANGLEKEIPDEIRVVFAKDSSGVYIFLGVFQCKKIDLEGRKKEYTLIYDKYPIQVSMEESL